MKFYRLCKTLNYLSENKYSINKISKRFIEKNKSQHKFDINLS